MTVDEFRALLANTDLFLYERSVDQSQGTVAAMVRRGLEKMVAVAGEKADLFAGKAEGELKLCQSGPDRILARVSFPAAD